MIQIDNKTSADRYLIASVLLLCVWNTPVEAASVASISGESFKQYGQEDAYWQVLAYCDADDEGLVIQKKTDGDVWCLRGEKEICGPSKKVAAELACSNHDTINLTAADQPAAQNHPTTEPTNQHTNQQKTQQRDEQSSDSLSPPTQTVSIQNNITQQRLKIEEERISIEQRRLELRAREIALEQRLNEINRQLGLEANQ